MSGISVYVAVGRYGGFGVRRDCGVRIVLGWVALAFVLADIEILMQRVLERRLEVTWVARTSSSEKNT